jgi:hypothetical protein
MGPGGRAHQVSLFLGATDIDYLQLTDLDIYCTLMGKLRVATKDLAREPRLIGTPRHLVVLTDLPPTGR